MRLFDRLVLKTFVPIFFFSLAFFVLIIQLMDLFANLVRYLNLEVPAAAIFRVQLLFLPRAVSFALPVSILFAAAYALGSLYSNNELIAVFSSGVPIWRFTAPLVIIGLFLSVALFVFQEYVVIETFRQKNEETRRLLNISRSFSNTNVTVRSADGGEVYSADYYNDVTRELSRAVVLLRGPEGSFEERIDAERGSWDAEASAWQFRDGSRYVYEEGIIRSEEFERYTSNRFTIPPSRFQRSGQTVDELRFDEARDWVKGLRDAGQAYRRPLTNYYSRFSFACTPFIVVLLASGVGGRFRKNVLLMSLFVSLVAAVVYYVTGMVTEILAGNAVIPPLVGAWAGVVVFTALGIALIRTTRT